jgi:hypothetical protein
MTKGEMFIASLSRPTTNSHGDSPHGDSHGDHTDTGSNSRGIPVTWIDSTSKSLNS